VPLDERARAALEAIRGKATGLRFAVEPICGSPRSRLSVYCRGEGHVGSPGSDEFRLGLRYGEDLGALEALRAELEAEEKARARSAAAAG